MAFLHFFTAFLALYSPPVVAQYQQDYITQVIGGVTQYFFQPTAADVPIRVVDLGPDQDVILVYNCFYMKDICRNVGNFRNYPRGQNPHPRSGIATDRFGYDFSNRRIGQAPNRKNRRRDQSCPGSWKDTHLCPEPDQRPVMRQDGQWFSNVLEPGTTVNQVINLRLPGVPVVNSGVRYTCDEFPPATWVEGGNGENNDDPGVTRCAAMRCMPGYKSEQNWQGDSHARLREELQRVVIQRRVANGEFTWFQNSAGVVLFRFLQINTPDGVAARVLSQHEDAATQTTVSDANIQITQAKRDAVGDSTEARRGLWDLSYDELRARIDAGYGSEHIIPANDSAVNWSGMPEMERLDKRFRWDDEDENEDDEDEFVEPLKPLAIRQPHVRSVSHPSITPLLKRATSQDIQEAQAIVKDAIAESSKLNSARLAKPLRNLYGLKPGTVAQGSITTNDTTNADVTPLLQITDKIADAAALVAEANAVNMAGNLTRRAVAGSGTFWMESLARKGTVPWGDDPDYAVFRNVLDYGAVGDGVTDDTKAIKDAMNKGSRCGEKCNGSTTKNAIVYFPPGNYLISSTIPMPFGTQVIGDANTRPTLLASKSFVGLGVLSTDEYTGGAGGAEQWYINTANFYRQIRNIVIDVTPAGQNISCLHYQVAQATSLQNVELIASGEQIGMYAENGSGGQISDVTFTGGIGIYGGNQQFTAQRLTFNGCSIGVHVIWDWGWVWKSITMTNVDVGFRLVSDDNSGNIGSVSVMDSSFTNVGTVVNIAPASSAIGSGSTGLALENVKLAGVTAAVADTAGKVYLDGSAGTVTEWALGPVYAASTTDRSFSNGDKIGNYQRPSTLIDSNGAYFERQKPQYENHAVGDFVHIKDMGVLGDGSTDDTAAFQAALYASLGKILFIDAGTYILTSTVTIPPGAKIVGETWSQLVASGSYFEDASNPKVLLQVGTKGAIGDVEMQDLIFTTRGATAGAILVEWNIQAATPGSAGLWDCHVRVGGATGTGLTPAECPASTSGTDAGCSAASLMMHLTSGASGYFENMWLWGADHMLDDPDLNDPANDMVQCSIYIARGFLIESTHPTWLYATASEHSVFYQYNFHGASNIFAGMLQTESPYFQPTPPPPAPFEAVVGDFIGDPDYTCAAGDEFNGCDESWAVIITESENIFIAGAGIYTWFSTYSQTCIDTQQCQKTLVRLDNNYSGVRIQNLITIGAKNMVVMNGEGISAADNLNVQEHPFWSQITILDVSGSGSKLGNLIWIDPAIWEMDQPAFTCVPPCHVKLPPWTGATSTVDYPLMTVSNGAWTSTVTQAPITISEWVLEVVTLTQAVDKVKRQGFDAFTPALATTPYWPAIVYNGVDGQPTTTAPSAPFPTPPPGALVKREVQPYAGLQNQPLVPDCTFFDFACVDIPWLYGDNGTYIGPNPGDDPNENYGEDATMCPIVSSSTSSSTTKTTSTTAIATPEPSPYEFGNPMNNTVECYDSGENTEGVRMYNAANSFCNAIKNDNLIEDYFKSADYPFPYNGGLGTVKITISLEIKEGCAWTWNYNECKKYLSVPTDSCNCSGVNGKQGGIVSNTCYDWRIDPQLSG